MKKITLYIPIIAIGLLTLMGCKSSKNLQKSPVQITSNDFRYTNEPMWKEWEAIRLDESADVLLEELRLVPWEPLDHLDMVSAAWSATITETILLLKDNAESKSLFSIDYFNPTGMRRDLMTKCRMWLYELSPNGDILKREMTKNEMQRERLNDSISRVKWDIEGEMAGKILVKEYTTIRSYYAKGESQRVTYSAQSTFYKDRVWARIEPWVFQKSIPLLHGQYKLSLPEGKTEVIKRGNGEMEVQKEKKEIRGIGFARIRSRNGQGTDTYAINNDYDADVFTVSASNVMPLPPNSDAQPLGVEVIRRDKSTDHY